MTFGFGCFDYAFIPWSTLYFFFSIFLLIAFLNLFSFISHINFIFSPILLSYFPPAPIFLFISFPQNASLILVSFYLFYTIPKMSKYIGSSSHSPNNPLEEAVNVIFLINNSNCLWCKYLKDDSLYIFIKARALFGVLVLNKQSSQQCSSPI